ncbi:MAG: ABC transporter permease [Candidatus Riflebacteria bacterium]|nr:ABC transporter permease [Candidatus Riflebacteria bacterium]
MFGFSVRIERCQPASTTLSIVIILSAMTIGLFSAAALFVFKGFSPLTIVSKILTGAFGSRFAWMETIAKAVPLGLVGIGLAVAFRGKFWNIGAEGQILLGAVAASGIALFAAPHLPDKAVLPMMLTAGFAAGAIWGVIPALLRTRFGVNEVVSTLMMNYVAAELVQYLVYGPWKGASQMGFPYSDEFVSSAVLPTFYGTRVAWPMLVIVIVAAFVTWFLITCTRWGFETRVIGENPEAARYAGISHARVTIILMIISGGLAGLAGVGEVSCIHQHLTTSAAISSGYGNTGIIVAMLGRLHPIGVLPAAIFLGGLLVGGDVLQTSFGMPFASVNLFTAVILLLLITGDVFLDHRFRIRRDCPASSTAVIAPSDSTCGGKMRN